MLARGDADHRSPRCARRAGRGISTAASTGPRRTRRSARRKRRSPSRCRISRRSGPCSTTPQDRAALDALHAWTGREHAARLPALRAAPRGRLRPRMPRRPPPRQHRRDRRRGHDLRLHRVQRRAALDRRDERDRVHRDGSRRPRASRISRTASRTPTSSSPATTTGSRSSAFYLVYRALVRAKVACLRAGQLPAGEAKAALVAEYRGYVALAQRYAQAADAGDRHHARSFRLRQDDADAGAARIDRRDPDPHRRRAQAPPRACAPQARSGSAIDAGLYTPRRDRADVPPGAVARRRRRRGRAHRDRRRHVPQALAARPLPCPRSGARDFRSRSSPSRHAEAALRARIAARAARADRRLRSGPRGARAPAAHAGAARRRRARVHDRRRCRGAARSRARSGRVARGLRLAGRSADACRHDAFRRLQRRCRRTLRAAAAAARRAARRGPRHRRQARHRAAAARARRRRRLGHGARHFARRQSRGALPRCSSAAWRSSTSITTIAGDIPAHPRFEAHIDCAPDVCTGILVDRHLGGAQRVWAVVAAFGDNLVAPARRWRRRWDSTRSGRPCCASSARTSPTTRMATRRPT